MIIVCSRFFRGLFFVGCNRILTPSRYADCASTAELLQLTFTGYWPESGDTDGWQIWKHESKSSPITRDRSLPTETPAIHAAAPRPCPRGSPGPTGFAAGFELHYLGLYRFIFHSEKCLFLKRFPASETGSDPDNKRRPSAYLFRKQIYTYIFVHKMFSALKKLVVSEAGQQRDKNIPAGLQSMNQSLQRRFAKGVQYNSK